MNPRFSPDIIAELERDFPRSIVRAVVAHGRARARKGMSAADHAARAWPNDHDVQLVLRAATSPLDPTSASAVTQIGYAILPLLVPFSCAAQLFDQCLKVAFGEYGSITVPGMAGLKSQFTATGLPKPVGQGTSSAATLTPFKIAGIAVLSSELYEQDNAEAITRAALGESAGPTLDTMVFSAAVPLTSHPPGLLNGIAALTPTAAGGSKLDTILGDFQLLMGAVGPVAGNSEVFFVANPGQRLAVEFNVYRDKPIVLSSAAVPMKTVIAVAQNALVSAVSPPAFETSAQATVHMDDAAQPLLAANTRSLWQTSSVGVKMNYDVSWALRSPQGVAWLQNVNW
jgi:hypothetical protein